MTIDPEFILVLLARGDYVLTKHARQRARERGVTFEDFQSLGESGNVFFGEGTRAFKIIGFDCAGDPLVVVAVFEFHLLIITVF
jgi:hypothetical protein